MSQPFVKYIQFHHMGTLRTSLTLPVPPPLWLSTLHTFIPMVINILLSYIAFFHNIRSIPSPNSKPYCLLIQKILSGFASQRKLKPITITVLHPIIDSIPFATLSKFERSLYEASFPFMYFTCLRVGEGAHSAHSENIIHISQPSQVPASGTPKSYTIHFLHYKHNTGATPILQSSPSLLYCPVTAHTNYIRWHDPSKEPLFINSNSLCHTLSNIVSMFVFDIPTF